MVTVEFTSALKRFFPTLQKEELEADTILTLIDKVDALYPGIKRYILTEKDVVREHVKVYVDEEPAAANNPLLQPLQNGQKVLIFQAISGG